MSRIDVTATDISLVKQHHQRRYFKVQLLDREWDSLCVIGGRLISATSSIEASEGIRRTANITIETEQTYINLPNQEVSIDLQRDISANYYIRLWAGIEDNVDQKIEWYNQGLFVIDKSQYNFDATTRTLSLGLIDLMCDLTGERGGILHAYTTLVKNEQRIDDVMINVLEMADFHEYNITPIVPLSGLNDDIMREPDAEDYMIPYDMDFPVGASAYDILNSLVTLYPYYEIGFDVDGTFYCRKKLLDQDDSLVSIDAITLADLVISEDTSLEWNSVKNCIEVWGKDGKYYGEAQDNNPESPFQVGSCPTFRKVITDTEDGVDPNNICDRYSDAELQAELIKEQASLEATIATLSSKDELSDEEKKELKEARSNLATNKSQQENNIAISGNTLATEWAEQKLYENSRMYDSIIITTICMPFLNDVNFKMSYRSKVDNTVRPYMVTSVSHDYIAGTSTFNMVRFYDDMCVNIWEALSKPIISTYSAEGLTLTVVVNPVEKAESYDLYIDGRKLVTSTGTTLSYTFADWQEGTHSFSICANAEYYRSSVSDTMFAEFSKDTSTSTLITNNNDHIVTNTGDRLIIE